MTDDRLSGGWERDFPQYRPAQLFALVADIERYPRFVPGCVATRILARDGPLWTVDNVFGFGPLRSRFTTLAEIEAPHFLRITSSDGPWRQFALTWRLDPQGADGCRLGCAFAVTFRSRPLAALARLGQGEMDQRIIAAFEKRAKSLYGS
jgi:coenzyme Q-binding protein COQ10